MTARTAEASPLFKARMAGLFYLLVFVTGLASVPSIRLVVRGDAVATATNILGHQLSFWLGLAAFLLNVACYIAVTALLCDLLKPVNPGLSLLAAFFSLTGCAIQAVSCVFYLAPVGILGGAPYLNVFKVDQLQALASILFGLYSQGYNIGLVFFGFYCLLIGYLVFRSTFLPRIVGVLMAFAGLGWLTFLSPPLTHYLSPYVVAPGLLGEGSLTLWLVIKGINVERWNQQASAAGARA